MEALTVFFYSTDVTEFEEEDLELLSMTEEEIQDIAMKDSMKLLEGE